MFNNFIIGIDEVGRGPLAGPIVFCAVKVSGENYRLLKKDKNLPKKGLDSKKIRERDRKIFSDYLKKLKKDKMLDFSIVKFSNDIIDIIGLANVYKKAVFKCLLKLKVLESDIVLLDGGLKADLKFKNQKTIIKGDEKEKVISWASILAKVYRDNLMKNLAKKYNQYDFFNNVGYGTKKHREAIKKYGVTKIHRKSFIGKIYI